MSFLILPLCDCLLVISSLLFYNSYFKIPHLVDSLLQTVFSLTFQVYFNLSVQNKRFVGQVYQTIIIYVFKSSEITAIDINNLFNVLIISFYVCCFFFILRTGSYYKGDVMVSGVYTNVKPYNCVS